MRQKVLEDRLLDGFAFGRGLDDQVALAQIGQFQRGLDPLQRGAFVGGQHLAARHLTFDVPFNRLHRLLQAGFGNVGHQHVIARQREDMGDPVAHLPGAHDAYQLDLHRHTSI